VDRSESPSPIAELLLADASGAVVDPNERYVGIIVRGKEYPHHMENDAAFGKALDQLQRSNISMTNAQAIRKYLWFTLAAGFAAISFLALL
jgi:hypothetical protein